MINGKKNLKIIHKKFGHVKFFTYICIVTLRANKMENAIATDKKMTNPSYTTRTEGTDGVSMAITSHLSDVEASTGYDEYVNLRCEFVKFLVHKYMVDIKDVDMDAEFELFKNK